MLPFPIISNLRILENFVIQKIAIITNGYLILTTSGKLYACGLNTNGRFGSSSTAIGTLTLIYDNVSNFICKNNCTFIFLQNNTVMCSGVTSFYGIPNGTTFVDCTTPFLPLLGNIKDIQISTLRDAIGILTYTGDLWFMGTNTQSIFGMSSPSTSTIFVQNTLVNLIDSFKFSYANVYALRSNGTLYGAGNTNSGQVPSPGTSFSSISAGVTSFSPGGGGCILYTTSTGLYARGAVTQFFGTSVDTANPAVLCSLPFTFDSANTRLVDRTISSSDSSLKAILRNGVNYYVSGAANEGAFSTSTSTAPFYVNTFTQMLNIPTVDNIIFVDENTLTTVFLYMNKTFISGKPYPLPGFTSTDRYLTFQEIQLIV